jgi:hypothetical protein
MQSGLRATPDERQLACWLYLNLSRSFASAALDGEGSLHDLLRHAERLHASLNGARLLGGKLVLSIAGRSRR